MSRYLRPGSCLDCGSAVGSLEVCPRCGLRQVGPDADALRHLLVEADKHLLRMRRATDPLADVTPGRSARAGRSGSRRAGPRRSAARLPAVSGSVVLLGLGALCVIVAAVVFVSVTWSDLSLASRAAILLGVTTSVDAVAVLAVRRALRGSAEVLSVLFAILVALDLLAARFGDLAGLGVLSLPATLWITSLLLVTVGVGWAVAGSRSKLNALVGPQLVAVAGLLGLTLLAFDDLPFATEYTAFLCAAAAAAAAAISWKRRLRGLSVGALSVAAGCLAVAALTSFARLAESDSLHELWLGNGAYGWLACCALVAAVASVASLPVLTRIGAAAGALAGITALLVRPAADGGADVSAGVLASAALLLAVLWVWRRGVWGQGARLAVLLPAVGAASVVAPSVYIVAVKCVNAALRPWALAPNDHPDMGGLHLGTSPLVTTAVVVSLSVVAWLVVAARPPSALPAAVVLATAVALGVLAYDIPLVAVVGVLLALALAAAAAATWRKDALAATVFAGCVPWLLLAAAGSAGLTALVSAVLCLLFGGLSVLRSSHDRLSSGCAAVAVWLLALSVAADVHLLGGGEAERGVGVTAVSAAALLAAQALPGVRRDAARIGVELGATVAAGVGFALAAAEPTPLSLALSLMGVAAVIASLVSVDRRLLSAPGGLLLAAASWVRLADADIDVVEAYTLPEALALLGVGAWYLRKVPGLGSVKTLLPGLSVALVPSLLRSLDSPTSVRALILGVCSLAIALLGAYWRLIAPLLAGAAVVAVLAVLNLLPYASALPRWVIFACAGAGLLFLGMTWERRLADLRRLERATVRFG